ncbi:class I SAM-dependent methyltransferase [Dermacoccaceae bacterium W4C1]
MSMTIGQVASRLFGADAPFRLESYDGSVGANPEAPIVLRLRNERGLRYLATAPGEIGLARAYLMDDLEVEGIDKGDPTDLLEVFQPRIEVHTPTLRELPELLGAVGLHTLSPPPVPEVETLPQWRRLVEGLRHSKKRDAEAIQHHYDVSNDFYEMVLGPSMAYTCACYPDENATLEQAQEHKFDLVCRKLALKPGMRLLDVGCGWGGMVQHAVRNYGVTAIGVTLSREQASYGQELMVREGLSDRAEIRYGDYRDIPERDFDAISSIGLTEHIGVRNYPDYFGFLYERLAVGGRLLNHCITRPDNKHDGIKRAGFINRYVFPDGELTGVGTIISRMQDTGFEIRHAEDLREHYARTCHAWAQNLSQNWDAAVAEAGEQVAKVWGLYLAGSSIGFRRNNIQLHQVLGEKIAEDGTGQYPLRPDFGV